MTNLGFKGIVAASWEAVLLEKPFLLFLIGCLLTHQASEASSQYGFKGCKFYLQQVCSSISLFKLLVPKPEKAMAPHSSTLAWRVPWMEEPHRLQSIGSLRVGPDWTTSLSLFTFMHWRRKWQPTPVFLPEEYQGQGSLVGCRLWGRTESETTEVT